VHGKDIGAAAWMGERDRHLAAQRGTTLTHIGNRFRGGAFECQ
jgi:hypothetical protein